MLKIELNGKSIVNPNEEIKNQFRQIIHENEQYSDEQIYDIIYDTIENIKNVNYLEYISIITLMYKDTYCYYNYLLKSNETNSNILEEAMILDANNINDILNIYYNNDELFLSNFVYILSLNNLFYIKILSNLNKYQNEILEEICPLHKYDEIALMQYTNFTSLEDYYLFNISENISIDDITNDIVHFLEYLYYYNRKIYYNYIKSIIQKIYKYCYYYLYNSSDIDVCDLEIRIIQLLNKKDIKKIGKELIKNPQFLNEIITRIIDDEEMGYPDIPTSNGYKNVKEKDLEENIAKIMKKQ